MKRWMTLTLVLALLLSPVNTPGAARAESATGETAAEEASGAGYYNEGVESNGTDEEAASDGVEAHIGDASNTGVEGLTIEGAQADEPEESLEVESSELTSAEDGAVAPGNGSARYARVMNRAAVYAEAGDAAALVSVEAGGVLLVLDGDSEPKRVAFESERGLVTGYVAGADLDEMDGAEVSAFMDAVVFSDTCTFYEDDPSMPLDRPACEFNSAADVDPFAVPNGSEFTVDGDLSELVVGASCTIGARDVRGRSIDSDELTFASSDDSVVSVNDEGVVTAVNSGSADIRVIYDGAAQDNYVVVPNEPDTIYIESTQEIGVKEVVESPELVMVPAGSASSVTWSSSNSRYVEVNADTGEMRGLKKGTATIYATTRNGARAACNVTVGKAPSKAYLSLDSDSASVGDTVQAEASVNSGASCGSFSYDSSNSGVAVVDENGVITAVGPGQTTITAVTYNGKKASANLTVTGEPVQVRFAPEHVGVGVGQSQRLNVVAYDATGSATSAHLTYEVDAFRSDGSAMVDAETGVVTGLNPGTTVVRAVSGNGVAGECVVTVIEAPVAIKLSASSLKMGLKESSDALSVILMMSDGSMIEGGSATWTSSKPKIVSVDETTGELTARKTGKSVITAVAPGGLRATCSVQVFKAPGKVTLTPEKLTLSEGMSAELTPEVPKKTGCASFEYRSSNPSVAEVDENGVVTATGEGTAQIAVRTFNGKTDTCTVEVVGEPVRLRLNDASLTLGEGQSAGLKVTAVSAAGIETTGAAEFYIDYASDDPGCIRLNERTGEIVALRQGTALVGARAHNGVQSPLCTVTVLAAPVSVSLPATAVIGLNETAEPLQAIVRFSNGDTAVATDVTWTTSKKKYVAVDSETGELRGVKKGKSTITVRTYNGRTASCEVSVEKAPTGISLSPSSLKLAAGGMEFALKAALSSGAGSSITYTSSNPEVATVDEDGVVTTVAKGTAIITASTFNGRTASCAVTVTALPVSASFRESAVVLKPKQSMTPQVSVVGSDGREAMAELHFTVVSGSQYIDLDSSTGEITAVKSGVAVVRVETHNGVRSGNNLTVTVQSNSSPTPIELIDDTEVTLGVGEVYDGLVGSFYRENVLWTTSNSQVASVDEDGYITAEGTGTATITATGGSQSIECNVTVKKAPSKITLTLPSEIMSVNATGKCTVKLSSSAGGSYSFDSSKPSVAAITADGVITALKAGTTVITVTTYNGKSDTATLTVSSGNTTPIHSDVEVPAEMKKYGVESYQDTYDSSMSNEEKLEYVIYMGQTQLGKPYIYGGGYNDKDPKGFDCSGFVYWCYKHIDIKLGSSAYSQGYDSKYTKITEAKDLKRGDVVCFNTVDDDDLSDHTGIYLGNGYFIHASSGSSKMKVLVQRFTGDSISNDYYNRNFSWGRRILD